jgi:phage gp36-like protein
MPYINLCDITSLIPGPFLVQALDDSDPPQSPPAADPRVLNQVLQDASNAVDEIVGGRYATPFNNPIPAAVHSAAKFFAIEAIYKRRGKGDGNPFAKDADAARAQLAKIAAGELPLDPRSQRALPSASAQTKPAGKVNA